MPLDLDHLARLYEEHAADLVRFFARRTFQADVAVDLVAETLRRRSRIATSFAARAMVRLSRGCLGLRVTSSARISAAALSPDVQWLSSV